MYPAMQASSHPAPVGARGFLRRCGSERCHPGPRRPRGSGDATRRTAAAHTLDFGFVAACPKHRAGAAGVAGAADFEEQMAVGGHGVRR